MRTRPWITMIGPRCCQREACDSVSPHSPQACKHAAVLTSLLSHSLSSSLCADLEAWGMDLWVGKNILLCPADPSPPLSSVLLISRKAINLDGLLSAPYPFLSDSEIWHPRRHQRGKGRDYPVPSWNLSPEQVRHSSFLFKIQGRCPQCLSVWIFEAIKSRLFN